MDACEPFVPTGCQRSAFSWTPLSQWCTFRWPDVSFPSFTSVVSPFSRVSPLLCLHDIRTFTAGSRSRWAASSAASMAPEAAAFRPMDSASRHLSTACSEWGREVNGWTTRAPVGGIYPTTPMALPPCFFPYSLPQRPKATQNQCSVAL